MSFGFGGTASHCFGGGLTGHSLSHAWSMGMDSIEKSRSSSSSHSSSIEETIIKEEQQRAVNESIKEEEMQEQETKSQAVPTNVPKYFSFKQHYPGHVQDKKRVTIKLAIVQYIEESDDEDEEGIFRICLNDGSYFQVNEKTAKELNDILYSL